MKRVYDMSFAEFQIRLFAWKRTQEREWEKIRILAWNISAASPNRKKSMPSLEKFMPLELDKKQSSISESQKQRFIEETAKYVELTKLKNG